MIDTKKFEIGDTFKVTKLPHYAVDTTIEKVYTVDGFDNDGDPYFLDDSGRKNFALSHTCGEEYGVIRLKKFLFGDKVIAIKDTPSVVEGWVGYVVETSPSGDIVARQQGTAGVYHDFKANELELLKREDVQADQDLVNSPKHYSVFEEIEAIEIIAGSMTQEQFYGYCLGNLLKYRLRVGKKDDVQQELKKADKYQELYTKFKHLCKGVE